MRIALNAFLLRLGDLKIKMWSLLLPALLRSTMRFQRVLSVLVGGGVWSLAMGAACHTVGDGDLSNPLVWDCGCDPATCDSLFIEHNVVAATSITLSNSYVEVGTSGSFTATDTVTFLGTLRNAGQIVVGRLIQAAGSPALRNHGLITCGVVHQFGDSLLNHGIIHATDTLHTFTSSRLLNHGRMDGNFLWLGWQSGMYNFDTLVFARCQTDYWADNSGYWWIDGLFVSVNGFVNETSGWCQADTILFYNNVRNYGQLSAEHLLQFGTELFHEAAELDFFPGDARIECGNLKNHGHIQGLGDICIQDSSINYATGTITQSPDICDATLTGSNAPFIDLNLGTIQGGVNWCANTTCPTTGVEDLSVADARLEVHPVPATDAVYIRIRAADRVKRARITDMTGSVRSLPFTLTNGQVRIDRMAVPAGAYLVELFSDNGELLGYGRVLFAGD